MHDTINYEVSVMEEAIKKKGIAEEHGHDDRLSLEEDISVRHAAHGVAETGRRFSVWRTLRWWVLFQAHRRWAPSAQRAYLSRCLPAFLSVWAAGVNVTKVAQQLGAKQEKEAKQTVHTSLIICTAGGAYNYGALSSACKADAGAHRHEG